MRHRATDMSEIPVQDDHLVSAVLRLRSALSLAVVALTQISEAETLGRARREAKAALLEVRAAARAK